MKLSNFVTVTIEWFATTIDSSSIMAWMNRRSMMVYGSMQAKFMTAECNIVIHG